MFGTALTPAAFRFALMCSRAAGGPTAGHPSFAHWTRFDGADHGDTARRSWHRATWRSTIAAPLHQCYGELHGQQGRWQPLCAALDVVFREGGWSLASWSHELEHRGFLIGAGGI